jgi:hypothetical protein
LLITFSYRFKSLQQMRFPGPQLPRGRSNAGQASNGVHLLVEIRSIPRPVLHELDCRRSTTATSKVSPSLSQKPKITAPAHAGKIKNERDDLMWTTNLHTYKTIFA